MARAGAPRHVGLGQAWLPARREMSAALADVLGGPQVLSGFEPPAQGRPAQERAAEERAAECVLLARIVEEWRLLSGDLRAAELQLDDSEDEAARGGEGGEGGGVAGGRLGGERRLRLLHASMLHRRMRARASFDKWLAACRARRGGPPPATAPACAVLGDVERYRGLGRDPIAMLRQSLLNKTTLYRML